MPWKMTARFFGNSAFESWSPLIGVTYAHRLSVIVGWFFCGWVLFCLGLAGMVTVSLSRVGGPGVFVVAVGIGFLGYLCWVVPFFRIDRLGRQLRQALSEKSIDTDRRAPLHSPYLYRKWLARNNLTAEDVMRAVDKT